MASSTGPAGLPWPEGDPGSLHGAARKLASLGHAVHAAGAAVRAKAHVDQWRGITAALVTPLVETAGRQLSHGAGPLGTAAAAANRLAGTLHDAQEEIRRLARQVEAAETAARQARAAADRAATQHANPLAPPALGSPSALPFGLDPQAIAAASHARDAEQHAADVRTKATKRAQDLCDEVERADESAAAAIDAAGAVAPAGGAAAPRPGGLPPGVVRRYAPIVFFHPDERYLPADATSDWRRYVRDGQYPPLDPKFLRGMGQGAPIYYFYDRQHHRIDYWYWRRWNDFRNLDLPIGGVHAGDWEGMSVQLDSHGHPTHTGYREHGPICAVPWDDTHKVDGHPAGWPALGSAATYPRPGSYDEPAGPWNDLAGGKPGQRNQRVDTETDLRPILDQPWADWHDRFGPDGGSPENPIDQQPSGPWWNTPCPEPADTVH
jgi:hypothetical protein